MKAFIISLDALVAVSVMFLMLALIFAQDFHPAAPRGVYLKQLSLDALSVLEKSERLRSMASGNSSAVRELLDAAPPSVCMQLRLIDEYGNLTSAAIRPGCPAPQADLQSSATVFAYGGDLYVATLESWYRGVPP